MVTLVHTVCIGVNLSLIVVIPHTVTVVKCLSPTKLKLIGQLSSVEDRGLIRTSSLGGLSKLFVEN